MSYLAIILAAGKSTRMGGKINKPFCEIGKEKLIIHLIDLILKSNFNRIIIVINSNYSEDEKNYIKNFIGEKCKFDFVYQDKQFGTGHAVKIAIDAVKSEKHGDVIVFYADTPLIKMDSIEKLKNILDDSKTGVICGFNYSENNQYGRIIFDENNKVKEIAEYKDYKDDIEIQKVQKCNSGIIGLKFDFLKNAIYKIQNNNNAKEYYLFDLLGLSDEKFDYLDISLHESSGANNFIELEELERIWQNEQRIHFMKNFVQLMDKNSVYFGFNNKIGLNVKICQNVVFGKNIEIGDNVVIESNIVLNDDVKIGHNTIIKSFSYISDSIIGDNCEIGPFAHLNGQNTIGNKNIIGNFVEVKRSKLGNKNKAKHLAYIGDAMISDENNFGAGSIICNYDGKKKPKTKIGNKNMIGSNSSIIAPIEIKDNNLIGAGTVLNANLDDSNLAVERGELKIFKKRSK